MKALHFAPAYQDDYVPTKRIGGSKQYNGRLYR